MTNFSNLIHDKIMNLENVNNTAIMTKSALLTRKTVYCELVKGPSSVNEIVEKTKVFRSKIYLVLPDLINMNMVEKVNTISKIKYRVTLTHATILDDVLIPTNLSVAKALILNCINIPNVTHRIISDLRIRKALLLSLYKSSKTTQGLAHDLNISHTVCKNKIADLIEAGIVTATKVNRITHYSVVNIKDVSTNINPIEIVTTKKLILECTNVPMLDARISHRDVNNAAIYLPEVKEPVTVSSAFKDLIVAITNWVKSK